MEETNTCLEAKTHIVFRVPGKIAMYTLKHAGLEKQLFTYART